MFRIFLVAFELNLNYQEFKNNSVILITFNIKYSCKKISSKIQ